MMMPERKSNLLTFADDFTALTLEKSPAEVLKAAADANVPRN